LTRLDENGFAVCHSTGTSGKLSFFPKSQIEQDRMVKSLAAAMRIGQGMIPGGERYYSFIGAFKGGWNSTIRLFPDTVRLYSDPDMVTYAFDEIMSADALRMGAKFGKLAATGQLSLVKRVVFNKLSKRKRAQYAARFQEFVQKMIEKKGERIMASGQTSAVYQAAAKGLEMGLKGLFHPDSVVMHGGGKKGYDMPDNYEEVMAKYFGVPLKNIVDFFGMTECNAPTMVCSERRKHVMPWLIPLLLNKEGTKALDTSSGEVTGRYAFLDLLADTYWGGITTGDRLTINFDKCACGHEGPQVLQIDRYKDIEGADEDKISCAAEMAEYVQAEIEE